MWCLRLEWLDCQKTASVSSSLLLIRINWPKAEGENSLSIEPPPSLRSAFQFGVTSSPYRLSRIGRWDSAQFILWITLAQHHWFFFQSSVCANNEQTVSMLDYLRKPRLEGSLQSFLNKLLVLSITAPTNKYNPQSSTALCFHSHVLLFPQKLLKSCIPIYMKTQNWTRWPFRVPFNSSDSVSQTYTQNLWVLPLKGKASTLKRSTWRSSMKVWGSLISGA